MPGNYNRRQTVERQSTKGVKMSKGLAPRGVTKSASQLLWVRYRFYFGSA